MYYELHYNTLTFFNKEGSVINAYVLSTSDSSFIESNVKDSEHIPAEEFNNLFSIL